MQVKDSFSLEGIAAGTGGISEATKSTEDVTVLVTGPKAGAVEVGGGYGAVNGTKTGAVP